MAPFLRLQRDTTWIEAEAARVDSENFNLEQEIKALHVSITESQELLSVRNSPLPSSFKSNYLPTGILTFESPSYDRQQATSLSVAIPPKSALSPALLITVSVASLLFLFVLLADSFLKGRHTGRLTFM